LNSYFKLSEYQKIEEINDKEIIFFNLIDFSYSYIPKKFEIFINNYSEKLNLLTNLNKDNINILQKEILYLIENKILIFIR
jgi:hypothetical protein